MVAVLETPAPSGSETTVGVALGVNVTVAALKAVAGVLTGSAGMLAEAAHSVVDTTTEVLLMVGIHRGKHPARPNAEYAWGLAAAVSMFFTGACYAVYEGLASLVSPVVADGFTWVAVVVLLVSMVLEGVSFTRALTQLWASKGQLGFWEHLRTTEDTSTKAVFAEDSMDLVGCALALGGILARSFTGSGVWDAAASILIGVLIGWVSYQLGSHNTRMLRKGTVSR
jgi:cation diffusion facilitator family transporter